VASKPISPPSTIRFGDDFELNVRAYELRSAGIPLKLKPIAMELLLFLIERRGEMVTRKQIVERIWGEGVFLDTDNSINGAISKLRQVLRDDAERPRFVQTVTGKGYRFIAPVVEVTLPEPAVEVQVQTTENLAGKRVSHYRILQVLGGGGMGVVYTAEDLKLGRRVALKFLPAEMGSDPKAFERLEREARAASALEHPNICPIYELGEHEGQPFIVMQLLEGRTLREWIESVPKQDMQSRFDRTLDLAIQMTNGLEAAHDKGIIHRDIKPANIFITNHEVKILDFGLAKVLGDYTVPEAAGKTTVTNVATLAADSARLHLTRTRTTMGTAYYMSPEQVRGEKLDARTDLFSLGVVLYEMVTGQRAFAGETGPLVYDAILHRDPTPVRQLKPAVPAELERIIGKSLDKRRENRYQSVAEMRADLQRLSSAPTHRVRSRKWPWIVAAAAALLLVGTASLREVRERGLGLWKPVQSVQAIKARPSVAVLGFKNLSGQPEQAWISTALAEMLTTELAAGEQLRTVPEENVAQMKLQLSIGDADAFGKNTLDRIRTALGSDTVVLGSYVVVKEAAGDKIRLDIRIQKASMGDTTAVLSDSAREQDLLELVSRTGARLRETLGVGQSTPAEQLSVQSSLPSNPEAARLYAEGIARLRLFDVVGAHNLLQRAVDVDPSNAMAHSALASTWSILGYDAKAAIEGKKAVDLSSGLSRQDRLLVEARYGEVTKDWSKAITVYQSLVAFFPDDLNYGLSLAQCQMKKGLMSDALTTIATLRRFPPPDGDDPRIDLAEAEAGMLLSDSARALPAVTRAEQKAKTHNWKLVLATAREIQGYVLTDHADFPGALAALDEARSIFAAVGDKAGAAEMMNGIATVHYKLGDYEKARALYEEARTIDEAGGNVQYVAETTTNLGNIDLDLGRIADAQSGYEKALQLNRETGNRMEIAQNSANLAIVMFARGQLANARKMYASAANTAREIGDRATEASAFDGWGVMLVAAGELPEARRHIEDALKIERELDAKYEIANSTADLGDIALAEGDIAGARKMHEEALAIRHKLGDDDAAAEDRLALGLIALEEGDSAQAITDARSAVQQYHADKRVDREAFAHVLAARVLLAQGQPVEARKEIDAAERLSAKSEFVATRLFLAITGARVDAALGSSTSAMKNLEAARRSAAIAGLVAIEFEARLAWAEVALRSGKVSSARSALKTLHGDAQAKGFGLVAHKAAALAASDTGVKPDALRHS
jgi:eukaryotic-like serine/threonine-protein kinase